MKDLILLFEDYAHKIAYLFNVINSNFIITAILGVSMLSILQGKIIFLNNPILVIFYILFLYFLLSRINFFPYFLISTPFLLYLFINMEGFEYSVALSLLAINFVLFFITQIPNYYLPYLIASRGKIKILFKIFLNSLVTIGPTNSSLIICLFFSTLLSWSIYFQPNPIKDVYASLFLLELVIFSLLTKLLLPKTYQSPTFLPKNNKALTKRVIYLNIDGTRLDKTEEAKMPFLNKLKKEGVYFKNGARSVYPALTNPAFMSILTGTTPQVHNVINNNFKRRYKIEALPDIIKTSSYGNIHLEDISKSKWDINIFPVAKYGFNLDEELFKKLKEDLLNKNSKLFVADISLVDMVGHAYGCYTKEYLQALNEVDKKLEDFFNFLRKNKLLNDTTVIISSDHGQAIFDHGYTLSKKEAEVPLVMFGKGIKKNKVLDFVPSILDLAPTICYLLGKKHLSSAKGKVLIEALN